MEREIIAGKKLRELRGDRSMEQVANDLGFSRAAISNYERGARSPRDEDKIKIANYYHTTVSAIFFPNEVYNT
jgi:transcriptional regulator with XRE-family HTH domain